MKRGFAWALALAMMLALLAGCGGSTGGETTASDVSNSETTSSAPMEDAGGSWGAWTDEAPSAEGGERRILTGGGRLREAKMIYTAHMEVETTAFDTADADLRTLVEVLGGYFEQAAVHNYASGYRSGDYTVRIPADQFHPFLERVGTLCHVTYQEESKKTSASSTTTRRAAW